MYLKQLIFSILIIFIRKHRQCYAKNQHFTAANVAKSNQTISSGNLLNYSHIPANETHMVLKQKYHKETLKSKQALVEDIADLYFITTHDVMGISNCAYDQTINITHKAAVLANGSYIYDNHIIIPPQLMGTYNYEILYNGTRRKVPQHKRACICQLKPCISVCSNHISDTFEYVINNAMYRALEIFYIEQTLKNASVVMKNIAKDFEHIVLKEFCETSYPLSPETNENSDWTLFENGSLLRHSDWVLLKSNDYCFDLHNATIGNDTYVLLNPWICATSKRSLSHLEKYNYWTQVISIIFLLLTISGYCCLPGLLDVHGKLLISYASNLALSFAIFSFINLTEIIFDPVTCLLMAYLNHFFQLSHYTWLAIVCFDIWKSCNDIGYSPSYYKYSLCGYLFPFLMTLFTFGAEKLNIYEALKPGIGEDRCGLNVFKWSAIIYLYGPCLIILLCCITYFILTSRIIKTNNKEMHTLQLRCQRTRYNLHIRLLIMMVVSWFLDIISFILQIYNLMTASGIIDYINSLQGLYIFISFLVRRKVRNIIKNYFLKDHKANQPRC